VQEVLLVQEVQEVHGQVEHKVQLVLQQLEVLFMREELLDTIQELLFLIHIRQVILKEHLVLVVQVRMVVMDILSQQVLLVLQVQRELQGVSLMQVVLLVTLTTEKFKIHIQQVLLHQLVVLVDSEVTEEMVEQELQILVEQGQLGLLVELVVQHLVEE
jgi:hypothetical protein